MMTLAYIILAIFIIIAPISMLMVIIVNGVLEWLDGRDKEDN